MKDPIELFLENLGYKRDPITEENPLRSIHNLEYAKKIRLVGPNGFIERQYFEGLTYYITYYEANLIKPETFPFNISHSNIYFTFNLEGYLEMYRLENGTFKNIKNKTYAPAYNAPGKHEVLLGAGKTRIFTIVFRSTWPKLNFLNHPHLIPLATLIGMQERLNENISLMRVDLKRDIEEEIEKIFNFTGQHEDIRIDIKKRINQICKMYNIQVDLKSTFPWIEAEAYMHKNWEQEPVKTEFFLAKFYTNKASFYTNFKEEFDNTPMIHQDLVRAEKLARLNNNSFPITFPYEIHFKKPNNLSP